MKRSIVQICDRALIGFLKKGKFYLLGRVKLAVVHLVLRRKNYQYQQLLQCEYCHINEEVGTKIQLYRGQQKHLCTHSFKTSWFQKLPENCFNCQTRIVKATKFMPDSPKIPKKPQHASKQLINYSINFKIPKKKHFFISNFFGLLGAKVSAESASPRRLTRLNERWQA